ncbi:hypothetical protein ILUMI_10710, partial [Ignelater luminosus]
MDKNLCLLCEEELKEENLVTVERALPNLTAASRELQDGKHLERKRNDGWSKTVTSRLIGVLDLIAEEAKYHDSCRLKFLKPVPVKEDVGRPDDPEIAKAIQKICDYIEESNDCQFSVEELLFVFDKKNLEEVTLKRCFVTFDQPLYAKAREIVALSPDLSNITVRLGGFRILMSFMSAVGHIMNGSGFIEVWSLWYASNSVHQILLGHHYARAIRAYFMTQTALGYIMLDSLQLSDSEKIVAAKMPHNFAGNPPELDLIERNIVLVGLLKEFQICFESPSSNGPALDLVLLHAASELRPSNASLFSLLQSEITEAEYVLFVEKGYFTIRRTDKLWFGMWSDMCIEQSLMHNMKTDGGFIQRRGVTENVISKWSHRAPALCEAAENFEEFCGIKSATSHQHIELRKSKIKKDDNELISLSNEIIGDESINCCKSLEIGKDAMTSMASNNNFEDVIMSQKCKVIPLVAINYAAEEKIAQTGEELTRILYKGKKGESIDRLRYVCFTQAIAKSKTQVKLESLPPTSGAAKMHFLR